MALELLNVLPGWNPIFQPIQYEFIDFTFVNNTGAITESLARPGFVRLDGNPADFTSAFFGNEVLGGFVKIQGSAVPLYNGIFRVIGFDLGGDLILDFPYIADDSGLMIYLNYERNLFTFDLWSGFESWHPNFNDRPTVKIATTQAVPNPASYDGGKIIIRVDPFLKSSKAGLVPFIPPVLTGVDIGLFTQFKLFNADIGFTDIKLASVAAITSDDFNVIANDSLPLITPGSLIKRAGYPIIYSQVQGYQILNYVL